MNKALQTLTALSIAFGGYVLAKGVAQGFAAANPSAHEIVAQQFAAEPLRSLNAAMFAWFPAESLAMRDAMVRVVESGEVSARALQQAVQPVIGPVHALLAGVPDADLVALLDDQLALHRRLLPEPLVCAQLVARGPGEAVLTHPLMAGYDLELHYAEYFSTLNRARYAAPAEPAADADFAPLAGLLSESELAAIEANRPDDPLLCGAAITMLQAVRDGEFPGAERVRRAFLVGMMSG